MVWFKFPCASIGFGGVALGAALVAIAHGLGSDFSLTGVVAVATLVNACFVTYIGYQQHQTSIAAQVLGEAKHRADLFDRRFAVFQATQKVLSKVLRDGSCDHQDVHEFTSWTQQAYFLFDDSIYDYLLEIRRKLIEMASSTSQLKDGFDIPNRQELLSANHAALIWLTDQLNMDASSLFSRFRLFLRH